MGTLALAMQKYKQKMLFEEPPMDDAEPGNLILSKHMRLNINKEYDKRHKNSSNANNNIIVVGGPGTGKSRGIIRPNALQGSTSLVFTDPKGEMLRSLGTWLMEHGYTIKVFNLFELTHSCGYNPFRYIRSDEQVMTLIDCILANTQDPGASKGDQFFDQAIKILLLAIFYYVYYFVPKEEQCMEMVMDLLNEADIDEKNLKAMSDLDRRFKEVETGHGQINPNITKADPSHVCLRFYRMFKQGTGKTARNILISAQTRLGPFAIPAIRDITRVDTLKLEEIGDSKQALFMLIPEQDSPYMFLAAMVYTQLFSILYDQCKIDNISTHQLIKGNVCALRSELFNSKATEEKTLKDAEEMRKRYQKAKIVIKEAGNEDSKYNLYQLVEEDGNVLKEFQSQKGADLYLDALNNGHWTHGNCYTTVPVHFLLDEFKNTGKIPGFDKMLTTMRSYHLSCTIIIQSIDQLKAMYDKDAMTIMAGCYTQIFLGGTNPEDLKYFSERLGVGTQTTRDTSDGNKKDNRSYKQDEFTLMKPDQLATMPGTDCVILVSGTNPIYDEKFQLESHPHYDPKSPLFDYHLYFNVPKSAPKSKTAKTALPATAASEIAKDSVIHVPSVSDFTKKRQQLINQSNKKPVPKEPIPVTQAFADVATAMGDQALAKKIQESTVTIQDLQPLVKQPFPPKKLQQPKKNPDEEILIYESGYPI